MASGLEQPQASSYAIHELIALVENGTIRIPHFQRGQRWGPGDVAKLFDSIYKGYPIGTLLFWKRPAPATGMVLGSNRIGTIRIQALKRTDALWVVDGQQRITSLATALLSMDGTASTTRELYFDLEKERFGWRPSGPGDAHLPVREAYKLPRVMAWLRERNLDGLLQDRAFKLADRLRNYRIPSYAVETEVEGDMAPLREVFDRINTFGKRMNRAEVFQALTSSDRQGTRDLRQLADDIASRGFGTVAENTLVLCVLSVRGPDVLRDFRAEFAGSSSQFTKTIDHADTAISRTITFLRDDAGVPHFELVPYQHLLVTLVRFFALHENPTEWERLLLRRWYWRAALHGPLPKLGATGTLRLSLNMIDEDSASDTVIALLNSFPNTKRQVSVGQLRWNRADSKTTMCALVSLGPMVPNGTDGEGAQIDVAHLLSSGRSDALRRVFPTLGGTEGSSSANRVFWPRDNDSMVFDDPAMVLVSSKASVLISHAISPLAAEALRRGNSEDFLKERHEYIRRVVDNFVDARAEWERPTRHTLASL